jgi:hypothetical protein
MMNRSETKLFLAFSARALSAAQTAKAGSPHDGPDGRCSGTAGGPDSRYGRSTMRDSTAQSQRRNTITIAQSVRDNSFANR